MDFVGQIAVILIATLLASALSQRVGLPAVIGQLLVGVLLGPGVFGILTNSHLMHTGSEIGVILLMFIAGIESDLDLLKKYFRPAILVAMFGVVGPMLLFYAYGRIMGQGFERSVFWGVIFAATSVSISVEVLRELKKLDTPEGATILGAAVVDDIIAVVLLSVFVSIFGVGGDSQLNLATATILQVCFFIVVVLLVKWVVPFILRLAERLPIYRAVAIVSLSICLIMAYTADAIGLSAVVGAFFAGVAVSQTKYEEVISNSVSSVGYTFFIPIFFVSIGLDMKFDGVLNNLVFIVIMSVLAVITKLYGGALGARIAGMSSKSAMVVGSGMISRGEMALIIAQIGISAKLIAPELYSEIIIVIIISTIIAPLFLKRTINKLDKFRGEES